MAWNFNVRHLKVETDSQLRVHLIERMSAQQVNYNIVTEYQRIFASELGMYTRIIF